MTDTSQALSLKQWQALYDDKPALVHSPEDHQLALNALAQVLCGKGVIDDAELADLIEQASAAYKWGVEEQLNSRPDHQVVKS